MKNVITSTMQHKQFNLEDTTYHGSGHGSLNSTIHIFTSPLCLPLSLV